MRILALAILASGAVLASAPARAQTYDPSYPICLHVYGEVTYYECRYSSLAQCAATAAGRGAQCVANPYLRSAEIYDPQVPYARHRRHHTY